MIPEFIGRLPIMTSVENLDQKALMQILTEPKNALVKQYQKLFDLDEVELEFTNEALEVVVELAIRRGAGARGLRAIMEETLLGVMYEVPSKKEIGRVVITPAVVRKEDAPNYMPRLAGGPRRAVKGEKGAEEKSA
jgi:ATP-dependent Clp protease ATP-binding subunit ClpX